MESSFNLEKGKLLFNSKERSRLKEERDYENMFLNKHNYTKRYNNGSIIPEPPLIPLPALVSEILSELLLGEFPLLESPEEKNQEKLDLFLKDNLSLASDFLEAATYTSALGTTFLYLFKLEDKVYHKFLKSTEVVWDEDILGQLKRVMIFNNLEDKFHYEAQVHEIKDKKHILTSYEIRLNDALKIKNIKIKDQSETGLDFIPIKKIENIKLMGLKTGRSDYNGKEQMFAEINERLAQANKTLDENQDPWIIIPSGILDEHGRLQKSNGKMIERSGGVGTQGNGIEIISYNPQVDGSLNLIKMMIEMIFFCCRISAPIAGLDKGGAVDSGRALKWKSINTFSSLNRRKIAWQECLSWMIKNRSRMGDSQLSGLEDAEIKILWQDGLPLDTKEVIDNLTKQIQNKILSRFTAIRKANEYSQSEAEAEMQQIENEQNEELKRQADNFKLEF